MWYVNYTDKVTELCIVSEDPEKEFNDFLKETNAKIISTKGFLIL